MRIGIDYTSAVRQRAGIGRYTRALVHALARIDTDNQYALLVPRDGRNDHEAFPENFRVQRAPLSEHLLVTLWQRVSFPLPVEQFIGPSDIFYSPDFVLPPTRSRKTILTVHDLSFRRIPETAVPRLKWYLEGAVPRAVKRADLIFADSNATRNDLIDLFKVSPDRVQTLYSGVEDIFSPVADPDVLAAARARYGLDRPFILTVGTLEPRKNLSRLIEAYSRLKRQPEFELVIVGSRGWLFDETLDAPRKFGVPKHVRFLGFLPDEDMPAVYSLATVFAYPSLYEGFGLPVLEAMACGVPVVTSNNSSLPEVADDAALQIDPRSCDELTAALERLIGDDRMRSDLAVRGLQRAKMFSWEAGARQLRRTFEAG